MAVTIEVKLMTMARPFAGQLPMQRSMEARSV
jgi:hypothetical protein